MNLKFDRSLTIEYYINNKKSSIMLPPIGFGTWKISDQEGIKAIYDAISVGFRYIDTAQLYYNEKEVGEAIKIAISHGIVSREELFIATKLENEIRGYNQTIDAVSRSLKQLQIDYIDMFMLHWPKPRKYLSDWRKKNMESWKAFEDLVSAGKIRSLGVCNFLEHHLEPLLTECSIKPCVNQLELHPYYWQDSIVRYCKDKDIVVESWSPIANGKCLDDRRLNNIGMKYCKSVAQVCIKYACDKGVMPIVKASSVNHMLQDRDLNWILHEDDVRYIDTFRNDIRVGRHPDDE